MASDRIGSNDIFQDNLFDGVKESASELVPELEKVVKGLTGILEAQKKILETSKVDSAENIKKINQAIKDSSVAKKGLIAAEKELEKLRQEKVKTDREVIKNEREQIKNETELEKKEREAIRTKEAAAKASEAAAKRAAREAREKAKLNSLYAQESARLNDLRKRLKELSLAGRTTGRVFKGLQQEVTALDKRLKAADAAAGQFQRNVGNYPSVLKKGIDGLKRFGAALGVTGGVIALANVVRNAFNVFSDFEQKQTTLGAILGENEEKLAALSSQAEKLGATTFFTAAQVSQLQIELAKLGFSAEQIEGATAGALNLAAAFQTDLGEAARITAGTVRGFNLEAEESGRVADVIASSFANSALDLTKFEVAVSKVAPIAANLNIDLETTTAVLGQLSNANFDASTAGTQFRNILLKLSDRNSDLAKRLGFTVNSSEELIKAFQQLNAEGIKIEETQGLIDVRSVALLQNLIENADAVALLAGEFNNAGGEAERIANEQLKTLQGQFLLLKSAFEGFVLSIENGNGIISRTIKSIVGAFTFLFNALSGLDEGFDDVSKQIGDNARETQRLIKSAKELGAEYKKLTRGSIKENSKEQERLNEVLTELKINFGENVVAINNETGALELNEEALEQQIKLRTALLDKDALALASRLQRFKVDEEANKAEQTALKTQEEALTRLIQKQNESIDVNEALSITQTKGGNIIENINAFTGRERELLEQLNKVRNELNESEKQGLLIGKNLESTRRELLALGLKEAEALKLIQGLTEDNNGTTGSQIGLLGELRRQLKDEIDQREKLADGVGLGTERFKELGEEELKQFNAANKRIKQIQQQIAVLEGNTKASDKAKSAADRLRKAQEKFAKLQADLNKLFLSYEQSLNKTVAASEKAFRQREINRIGAEINEAQREVENFIEFLDESEATAVVKGGFFRKRFAISDEDLDSLIADINNQFEEIQKLEDQQFDLRQEQLEKEREANIDAADTRFDIRAEQLEKEKLKAIEVIEDLESKEKITAEESAKRRLEIGKKFEDLDNKNKEIANAEKEKIQAEYFVQVDALSQEQADKEVEREEDKAEEIKRIRFKQIDEQRDFLLRELEATEELIQQIIALYEEKARRQNEIEKERLAEETRLAEKESDRQFQLAVQGSENTFAFQEQRAAESRKRQLEAEEQARKEEEALRLASIYFAALEARLAEAANQQAIEKKGGAKATVTPNNAPFLALRDAFLGEALSQAIVGAFATGVENFQGKGTETSDSNLIAFSHGESVVTAKGTRQNQGLVTAMNEGRVDDYFKRVWLPKFDMDNATTIVKYDGAKDTTNYNMIKELKELKDIMSNRPVQQVHVDSFGNIIEESYVNGAKTVITHKRKSRL